MHKKTIYGCRTHWPRVVRAWVCVRSLAGIAVSNPGGGMDVCLL